MDKNGQNRKINKGLLIAGLILLAIALVLAFMKPATPPQAPQQESVQPS
jgi:hypothetical protein